MPEIKVNVSQTFGTTEGGTDGNAVYAKGVQDRIDHFETSVAQYNEVFLAQERVQKAQKRLRVEQDKLAEQVQILRDILDENPYADAFSLVREAMKNLPASTRQSAENYAALALAGVDVPTLTREINRYKKRAPRTA